MFLVRKSRLVEAEDRLDHAMDELHYAMGLNAKLDREMDLADDKIESLAIRGQCETIGPYTIATVLYGSKAGIGISRCGRGDEFKGSIGEDIAVGRAIRALSKASDHCHPFYALAERGEVE